MLNLFKKKKEDKKEVALPPPPLPPEAKASMPEKIKDLPELPEIEPELPMQEPVLPELSSKDAEHFKIPTAKEHPTFMRRELDIPDIHAKESMTPAPVFDKTIKEFAPSREAVIKPKEVKQMFVAVDDYSALKSDTNFVRSKLVEAEEYLQRLTDLKNQEMKAFDKWRKTLEQAESKLSYVDKVIAEAQG